MNQFNLSVLGWAILIVAIAIAAYMLHAPTLWIAIATLALLGIGIIASAAKSEPGSCRPKTQRPGRSESAGPLHRSSRGSYSL